jgi:hypothetical protein
MPGSGALQLGPVARRLLSPDKWTDGYPAWAAFSRELDALLYWADLKGCLSRFLGPLESRNHQRDEALNELRLAYLFDSLGYPVIQWDPPGANGKIGEFLLDTPEKVPVFSELKSPGWESELSPAQIKAGRQHLPKYNGLDGGAVGNYQPVHRCMASPKTYPKFTDNQANLLIISDDLKLSLHDTLFQVEGALYGPKQHYGEDGYFTTNRFENIGGLGVFYAYSSAASQGLEYKFVIYENHHALPATKLPQSLLDECKETFTCIVKGTDPRRPAPVR